MQTPSNILILTIIGQKGQLGHFTCVKEYEKYS